jgi:hypothetical protein
MQIGKTKFQRSKLIAHISQNSPDSTSFLTPVCIIKNQTSYSVKLLAQRKVLAAQPSSPRIKHPKLYVYTFISSFNIFSSILPSPTPNLRTTTPLQLCLSFLSIL